MTVPSDFPASLEIDYPDRDLDRFTTLFRPFAVIPIAIVLGLVSGSTVRVEGDKYLFGTGGVVFCATLLMLVFRQKYPRWWFDWHLGVTQFGTRVSAYMALLRDEYPATDDEQAVHVTIRYPDAARDLNRWLPLVKWILAVPHYIVLTFLAIAAVLLRDRRLVRHPVHRPLSAIVVRLRGRGDALVAPGERLRIPAHDRSLSAVQCGGVMHRRRRRRPRRAWVASRHHENTQRKAQRQTAPGDRQDGDPGAVPRVGGR